ncbi:LytTR family DNA-binding domain-containing protein [uncultured Mucilaginibacter sp.]|uniref:LytR/AlgR family response regulator transcription factor n=1 Tax=uncultured Mucilaginibacter sp. TaxID=797541 RepID=UPI0025FCAFC3|nr:LytTR family DNA-binding domain-containing protein [uncultured Mucilaginibacter sp.]
MIKAVIVEDSRLARVELKELLRTHGNINIIGEADSADKGIELIKLTNPDLVFLDIHLPGATGFDLLEKLDCLPAIIFTTAFEQYALQSFDYHTIDYVLKPIAPERLAKAILKASAHFGSKQLPDKTSDEDNRIFIKDQHKAWLVPLKDVRYFESKGNYIQVFFGNQSPLMLRTLQQLEETLNPKHFIRINRQQIVNLRHVVKVNLSLGNRLRLTLSDGFTTEVSRRQVAKFKEQFEFNS